MSERFLWYVNWWKKCFTLTLFLKPQISKKCTKWFIRFWRVTSGNDVQETFINQEICYIDFDGEMKLSTVSHCMKEFLSIIEIKNKSCHIWYNRNIPNELVSGKLIVSLDGLNIPNSPWKIYHPNCTSLSKKQLSSMKYFKIISIKHWLKM